MLCDILCNTSTDMYPVSYEIIEMSTLGKPSVDI